MKIAGVTRQLACCCFSLLRSCRRCMAWLKTASASACRCFRPSPIRSSSLTNADFLSKNGIKAEIIRINSEPTTYQALISGDIDATSGAPTGLVQSNLQGVPRGIPRQLGQLGFVYDHDQGEDRRLSST